MASCNLTSSLAARPPVCTVHDSLRVSRTATAKASTGRLPALVVRTTTCARRSSAAQDRRTSPLSSSHSRVFANAELGLRFGSGVESSKPSKAVAEYRPEQAELVKRSWQLLKKDAGKNGMTLFLKVFEIAPSAIQLFSFLRDSPIPLEQNSQLKGHAVTVFKLVGDAANQLGETGGLDSLRAKLVELGGTHYSYGIMNEHFDVVKFALLQTIQEGLPEMWSPELKGAWAQAYDEVVAVIKDEMQLVKAAAKEGAVTA